MQNNYQIYKSSYQSINIVLCNYFTNLIWTFNIFIQKFTNYFE